MESSSSRANDSSGSSSSTVTALERHEQPLSDDAVTVECITSVAAAAAAITAAATTTSTISTSTNTTSSNIAAAAAAQTENAARKSQLNAHMIMQKGKYGAAMFITNELAREKLQLRNVHNHQHSAEALAEKKHPYIGNLTELLLAPSRPVATDEAHDAVEKEDADEQRFVVDDSMSAMESLIECQPSPYIDDSDGSYYLNVLLDNLLAPDMAIDDAEMIDWCKWLIAGGRIPDDFASIVRGFDNNSKCGLVWIPHVVAYRCRTCGISPCMSICRECFKKGDHSTHDFNMFLSQAGGACDCGDTSVMKPEGFCSDHGLNNCSNKTPVPKDLMLVANRIMPRLLLRLLLHFRQSSHNTAASDCDEFCSFLMELNNMGELMRSVMTKTLINPEIYSKLVCGPYRNTTYGQYLKESDAKYKETLNSFPHVEPPDEYKHLPALAKTLHHSTLLEEFIFWTFKYEFPQNIVCFLLNMLPDLEYKEHLTRTFVMHYSRITTVLELSKDPDTLSNRVVHMSVQLFSNESLALKMVNELNLLHVMIISLKLMMAKILVKNTLHDPDKNFHYVIDCAERVMKEHCYWPLVSDFNNVLSHESVALVFLNNDELIEMWFQFLSMLQGMNVNIKETGNHVEFEPSSYYAAFSCELEASAYPMWSIMSHLKESKHANVTKNIMKVCINYLQDWLDAINFNEIYFTQQEMSHASFHLPLHRYLAAFTFQAVKALGMSLNEILPSPTMLMLLMIHPLKVQSLFYEILAGIWVRNGLQIKGQAMTYIQANFCNSMVDMDLYFLQLCATNLPAHLFLETAIDIFNVSEWLGGQAFRGAHDAEQDAMLEGLLTFLATLVTSKTNLGNDEAALCKIEISALLATGDRTHSQLLELMPERSVHTRNFEQHLRSLSTYRSPPVGSENLEQGLFMPLAEVWEHYYDPLHVLLRAVHRRDFQSSMDRFTEYVKGQKKLPSSGNLWPPFRLPVWLNEQEGTYTNPCRILNSKVMHAVLLAIFQRALYSQNVSENLLALAVFLLEIAVTNNLNQASENKQDVLEEHSKYHKKNAMDDGRSSDGGASGSGSGGYAGGSGSGHGELGSGFNKANVPPSLLNCYPTDCLAENLRAVINRVSIRDKKATNSPASYVPPGFDSDYDWDVFESDNPPPPALMIGGGSGGASASGLAGAIGMEMDLIEGGSNPLLDAPPTFEDDDDDDVDDEDDDDVDADDEGANDDRVEAASSGSNDVHMLEPDITEPTGYEIVIRNEAHARADSYLRQMMVPFTRPPPPPPPPALTEGESSNLMAMLPSNRIDTPPLSSRMRALKKHSRSMDEKTLLFDESIISLLLKLHSHLSGTLDSFSLDDDEEVTVGAKVGSEQVDKTEIESNNAESDDVGMGSCENVAAASSSSSKASPTKCDQAGGGSNAKTSAIHTNESCIGDGPYFIGRVLRKIAKMDKGCAKDIQDIRCRLWPNQRERQAEQQSRENREREDRNRRAKERQMKLMAEFANKQRQFMEGAGENLEGYDNEEFEQPREKEYVCIICNRTSASTENDPVGLVVLVESSSVLGHRRQSPHRVALPLKDEDRNDVVPLQMSRAFNERIELLSQRYGERSWYFGQNLGWKGGIHVQSCGHHVHLTCHDAYISSLFSSQRPSHLNIEQGEFLCPVCRQLSNCVLPLTPQVEIVASAANNTRNYNANEYAQEIENVRDMFLKPLPLVAPTKLSDAMRRAMTVFTDSKQLQTDFLLVIQYTILLPMSIARTNLECEIIQRGGSLCTNNQIRYKPKRDCIVPLLHVLITHLRVIANMPLALSWSKLCGLPLDGLENTGSDEMIPHFLADPVALMLKFILLAPVPLSESQFTCIIKATYNLMYYQGLLQLCGKMSRDDLQRICDRYTTTGGGNSSGSSGSGSSDMAQLEHGQQTRNIGQSIALAIKLLNKGQQLLITGAEASGSTDLAAAISTMERELQELCLPFLRVAALLRHHIYQEEIPEIKSPSLEFVRLVYYLKLVNTSMDWSDFNAAQALEFIPSTPEAMSRCFSKWFEHLFTEPDAEKNMSVICSPLLEQHVTWHQPGLLALPREYEKLFTYYHEQTCPNCQIVPIESSICLLCGTIVCLKQHCCKTAEGCEAVRHSLKCGGGTCIFLVVTSTYIIVIRGKRACLWGSLYLDDYDEEDRDLKRGKPLYLSEDRFNLLESQWLSHRFANTKHSWVWHRDSL